MVRMVIFRSRFNLIADHMLYRANAYSLCKLKEDGASAVRAGSNNTVAFKLTPGRKVSRTYFSIGARIHGLFLRCGERER